MNDTKPLRKLPTYLLLDSVDDAKHSTPDKVSVSKEANRRGYVRSRWDDNGTAEAVGASVLGLLHAAAESRPPVLHQVRQHVARAASGGA